MGLIRSSRTILLTTTFLTPSVAPEIDGALDLIDDETDGFAIEATHYDDYTDYTYPLFAGGPVGGTVSVINTADPTDNLTDVALDASNLVQSGTSPKMVHWNSSPYVRWTPHNLFLNSAVPATQNVTLVTGSSDTVTVTGAGGGNITGTSGASGTATTGSPATFTATGTTGTFTLTGSLDTIQINRGPITTPYLATTGAIRIGIPQGYDNVAGKFGIWVEPAATNLVGVSENIAGGGWNNRNSGETVDTDVAPDGSTTADTLTGSGGTTTHAIYQNLGDNDAVHTLSVYVKAGTCSFPYLLITAYVGTNYAVAVFDLTNASATAASETAVGATSGTILGTRQENVGDGWFRISLTGNLTATANGYRAIGQGNAATGNSFSTEGEVSSVPTGLTLKLWGYQVQTNYVATSYTPSHTAFGTATRAADNINVPTSSFNHSATEGTVYFDGRAAMGSVVAANQFGWQMDDGTANEKIRFYRDTSSNPIASILDGGAEQLAPMDLGTITADARVQATVAWKANLAAGSVDGGAAVDDTTLTLPTVTTFRVGADINLTHWDGFIYRILHVPRQIEEDADTVEAWRYNF
jgi:hypothetical protein